MKKIIIAPICFFFCLNAFAQQQPDPVHWEYKAEKTGQNTYALHLVATMDEGWHIYAQQQPKEAISVPTKITISKNPLVTEIGQPKEVGTKEMQEIKDAGIKQYYYAGKVEFIQTIKVKADLKTNIRGTVAFQTCTNAECLPVKEVSFDISLFK